MNLGIYDEDYPAWFPTGIDPKQMIENWYDLLDDP